MDYQTIKQLAKELNVSIQDLIVLAPQNDPFYVGSKSDIQKAYWFASLWERFGYTSGVHLRRVHYQLVSQDPPILKCNGKPYENTVNDWHCLNVSSKYARYLWLVNPDAFVDRRNPEPIINARWPDPADAAFDGQSPSYSVEEGDDWDWYELPDLPELPNLAWAVPDLPDFEVGGYSDVQQSYHLEVWVEKTTANDVLEPLCGSYNVNLVTGAGELSITAVLDLVQRVGRAVRPCRIFYISDFDPAGYGMPVSVARKIEFFLRERGLDLDICVEPVVLTKDQVIHYQLPRRPIKDTERRKARFEDVHGEGTVELDALEALHPGELAEIVEERILNYYDRELGSRTMDQLHLAWQKLHKERERALNEFADDLGELRANYSDLREDFAKTRESFAELVVGFQKRIDPYQERLEAIKDRGSELYAKLYERLEEVDVDLPDLPEPDLPPETNSKQLDHYKAYQDGNTH